MDLSAVSALRNKNQQHPSMHADPTEVISPIMETAMSKSQYLLIRNFVDSKISFYLIRSYQAILSAKKRDTLKIY